MPRIAGVYIALIICSGTAVLLVAAASWSSPSLRQFLIFFGLAAISSTLKVRIPGIEGTFVEGQTSSPYPGYL
jgi:Na+/alanine symporter